jgi:UDP-N-acetylglucosamine:LPS N-acetylglucosamine transferase
MHSDRRQRYFISVEKTVTDLIKDDEKIGQMSKNIRRFGNPQAAKVVAERIRNLCGVES